MSVLIKPHAARRKTSVERTGAGKKALTGILTENRFFRLRKPVSVNEHEDNGVWVHECKPLRIYAFGETRTESWQTFVELFECNWDSIAQERDAKLTVDARELKREYLDFVESVEPIL